MKRTYQPKKRQARDKLKKNMDLWKECLLDKVEMY